MYKIIKDHKQAISPQQVFYFRAGHLLTGDESYFRRLQELGVVEKVEENNSEKIVEEKELKIKKETKELKIKKETK